MSNATTIDVLQVIAQFKAEGVDQTLQQLEGRFKRGLSSIVRNFAAPVMAAMSFRAVLSSYTEGAALIGQMAERIGVSSEALQAWGGAAERAGGSVQALQGTVANLTRRITSLTRLGGSEGAEAFRRYGLSIRDANGNIKDSFDILRDLAGMSERMGKQTFNAVASQIGIDQGTISLLSKGSQEVEKLIQRQKELGFYTKQDYETAQKYKIALADLTQSFKMAASVVMRVVTPAITTVTTLLTNLFGYLRRHEGLITGIGVGAALVLTSKLVPAFKLLSTTVMSLPLMKTLGQWAAMITAIALIVEDFIVYMKGGNSAFEGLWSKFGDPEELQGKLKGFLDAIQKIVETLGPLTKNADVLLGLAGVFLILGKAGTGFYKVLTGIIGAFKGVKAGGMLAGAASSAGLFPVIAIAAAVAGALVLIWKNWDKIKDAAVAAWDWTKNAWSKAGEWFRNLGAEIKDAFKDAFAAIMDWVPSWKKIKAKMFGTDEPEALPKTEAGTVDVSQTPVGQALARAGNMGFPLPYGVNPLPPSVDYAMAAIQHGGAMAGPVNNSTTSTSTVRTDNDVNIGNIYVNAPEATDARGIANGIGQALQSNPWLGYDLALNLQSGVNQK